MSLPMKIITSILMAVLSPMLSLAQRVPSPAGMWCQYCKPQEVVVGPVRTVLSVEKREESPFGTVVETYDAQGRRIETLSHSSNREIHSGQIVRLDSKIIYLYDSKARLVKHISYSVEQPGEGRDSLTFVYDESGRLKEETTLYGDGTPFLKSVFSYEPEKRTVIAMTTCYVEGRVIPPFKAVLIYDDKGQWIKKSMFRADGSPDGIAEFSYDKRGYLIKETRYDDDGKYSFAHMFTYKYDANGNWFERLDTYTQIDKDTGKPTSEPWMMMYRVITYFNEK